MKLPKKLEPIVVHNQTELDRKRIAQNRDKINEIRDYLSDKEASKGEGCTEPIPHFHRTGCSNPEPHTLGSLPCCKGLIPPQQEESMGECPCYCHCEGKCGDQCKHISECSHCKVEDKSECCNAPTRFEFMDRVCDKCNHTCNIVTDPPKQDECKQCLTNYRECVECRKNMKPQLKEESPKEDEWIDDLYENFSSHWDKNGRSLETFIRELLLSKGL